MWTKQDFHPDGCVLAFTDDPSATMGMLLSRIHLYFWKGALHSLQPLHVPLQSELDLAGVFTNYMVEVISVPDNCKSQVGVARGGVHE